MRLSVRLDGASVVHDLATLVRDTRVLLGWSQRTLATRAATSQSCITRLERGVDPPPSIDVIARILTALGLTGSMELSSRGLDDRRDQRIPLHGLLLDDTVRRLGRRGWQTATEVEIPGRDGEPRGWIDLLGFRPVDGSGLIGEIKGDVPDPGAMQRQVAFYGHMANAAMRRLGWRPRRITTLVIALDSAPVHVTLQVHRHLLGAAFPGSPDEMDTWLRDAGGRPPPPTIALVDPASRRERWLLRTPMSGRRSPAGHASYADAAQTLRRPRPPRGPPGSHRRSRRSPPP